MKKKLLMRLAAARVGGRNVPEQCRCIVFYRCIT